MADAVPHDRSAASLEGLIADAADQYRMSDEAREGILALVLRLVDEYQFGKRELDVEELSELARVWSMINDGLTAGETTIDWLIKQEAARRPAARD